MIELLLMFAVTKPVHPVMRPLVLKVPGTEAIGVLHDVAYEQTPGGPQLADVYLPPKKSASRPIAIFIHGGVPPDVPRPKSWGVYESWGRTIAASGFVGVVFNHRLQYPDPHLQEAQADLDAILSYVKAHAAEWNADANRIALFAYSAGGPLLSHPLRDHPANIRCIVSFYNYLDNADPEFSPTGAVNAQSPPIFVIRAGKDQIPNLNQTIAAFVARAIEVGAPLTFVIHPGAPHGFENSTDDARTREILETAIDFAKRHTR